MKQTLLSFGHGYSAQALSRLLLLNSWDVVGTSRSATADPAQSCATRMMVFPGDSLSDTLKTATHILISAAPDADGDPVLRLLRDEITHAAPNLEWVGYLSTTGVYGDHQGGWVTEDTPLTPSTQRGQYRVAAEAEWQSIPGLPLHIFRLAGIYGPGRGPFAKVRNGTARRIIKDAQVFSRIHVDDIAQALAASIAAPDPGAIYNLCDDDPAPPQDVIEYAAQLLGLPVPPAVDFQTAEMSPMARSFYAESKRVDNSRLKDDLGVNLFYPGYREGLKSLLLAETVTDKP